MRDRAWLIWLLLGGCLLLVVAVAAGAFFFIRKKINGIGAGAAGTAGAVAGVPAEDAAQPVPSDYPTERLDLAPPVNDNLTQPLPPYPEHWEAGEADRSDTFPWARTEGGAETSTPESESDTTKGE
ncbi:hypothetical protein ACUH94_05270 [Dermabacteraceae bacterium P7074]